LYSSPEAGLNAALGIGKGQKLKESGVWQPCLLSRLCRIRQFTL